jgi:hypothetical protein
MSRVRTWRSNTAGPKINSIDCQRTRSRSPRLVQRIAETGASMDYSGLKERFRSAIIAKLR